MPAESNFPPTNDTRKDKTRATTTTRKKEIVKA
jgi:hypothetical protein